MIGTFTITTHDPFRQSLKRFLKYLLNEELLEWRGDLPWPELSVPVLILESEKDNTKFLDNLCGSHKFRAVLIGFSDRCMINLLHVHKLSQLLSEIARSKKLRVPAVFTRHELLAKLDNFFKGHGRESIFKVLNFAGYAIKNYHSFISGVIDRVVYLNQFASPGVTAWTEFNHRFDKYKPYLVLLGFRRQVKAISRTISDLNSFWAQFPTLFADAGADGVEFARIKKVLADLEKIDHVLVSISMRLGIGIGRYQSDWPPVKG